MTYTFELKCPRCGKQEQIICAGKGQGVPHLKCSYCLYNDVEIVELDIVSVEVTDG
jgi:transcription elongation factor Elf1